MERPGKLKPGEGKLSARTPPAYRGRRARSKYRPDLGKDSFDVLKVLAILETAAHFEVGHAEITAYSPSPLAARAIFVKGGAGAAIQHTTKCGWPFFAVTAKGNFSSPSRQLVGVVCALKRCRCDICRQA